MFDHFRILALLSDGFGGFGGISKFNIDLLEALDACDIVERVYVLPRIISNPIDRPIPESVVFDRKVANNKVLFVRKLLAFLLERQKIKLVICGHLNLLPLAAIAAFFCRARLALIIHGVEAWHPRNWLVRLTTRGHCKFRLCEPVLSGKIYFMVRRSDGQSVYFAQQRGSQSFQTG